MPTSATSSTTSWTPRASAASRPPASPRRNFCRSCATTSRRWWPSTVPDRPLRGLRQRRQGRPEGDPDARLGRAQPRCSARMIDHRLPGGHGNSEPEHWQSLWHRATPGSLWVEHADWDRPTAALWVADLETAAEHPRPQAAGGPQPGVHAGGRLGPRHCDPSRGCLPGLIPDRHGPRSPDRSGRRLRRGDRRRPPLPAPGGGQHQRHVLEPRARAGVAATWTSIWSTSARSATSTCVDIGAWDEGR